MTILEFSFYAGIFLLIVGLFVLKHYGLLSIRKPSMPKFGRGLPGILFSSDILPIGRLWWANNAHSVTFVGGPLVFAAVFALLFPGTALYLIGKLIFWVVVGGYFAAVYFGAFGEKVSRRPGAKGKSLIIALLIVGLMSHTGWKEGSDVNGWDKAGDAIAWLGGPATAEQWKKLLEKGRDTIRVSVSTSNARASVPTTNTSVPPQPQGPRVHRKPECDTEVPLRLDARGDYFPRLPRNCHIVFLRDTVRHGSSKPAYKLVVNRDSRNPYVQGDVNGICVDPYITVIARNLQLRSASTRVVVGHLVLSSDSDILRRARCNP